MVKDICVRFSTQFVEEFKDACQFLDIRPEEVFRRAIQGMINEAAWVKARNLLNPKQNNLFCTCSLIECIARKKHRKRRDIVNVLGKERLSKIYSQADEDGCDNIQQIADNFIAEAGIEEGDFDNVGACNYDIPTFWDIGQVYQRLIERVCADSRDDVITSLINVYNSFISDAIDDYNSSFCGENPDNQFIIYKTGKTGSFE